MYHSDQEVNSSQREREHRRNSDTNVNVEFNSAMDNTGQDNQDTSNLVQSRELEHEERQDNTQEFSMSTSYDNATPSSPTAVPSSPITDTVLETVNVELAIRRCYEYKENTERWRQRLLSDLQSVIDKISPNLRDTRLYHETSAYLTFSKSAEVGYCLTADQYRSFVNIMDEREFFNDADCCNSVVICDEDEARDILEQGTPLAPLVVRWGHSTKTTLTIKDYCEFLGTKSVVKIHRFSGLMDDIANRQPVGVSPSTAMSYLRSSDIWPVSFVNLDGFRQNATPRCLEGLRAYSILTSNWEGHTTSGKRERELVRDLAADTQFQILGKEGALRMPRRDADHVMTTIEVEQGCQVWLMWPQMSTAELKVWASRVSLSDHRLASPDSIPMVIILHPGDILIQPPGRVYATYCLTDVLATGTRQWDSRTMSEVPLAVLQEQLWPDITSGDTTRGKKDKLERIEQLWAEGNSYWNLGGSLELYQRRLNDLYHSWDWGNLVGGAISASL